MREVMMVVDDDEGVREALEAILQLEGFKVELAANGREALTKLSGRMRPKAIFIDLMMPVMSGWELLDAIQRDPTLSNIPIAVVSAARSPSGIPQTAFVLSKPFDLTQLLQFLEKVDTA